MEFKVNELSSEIETLKLQLEEYKDLLEYGKALRVIKEFEKKYG